jgi:hypothetical protein
MLVLMILRSLTVLVLVGAVVARPAQKPSERERKALVTLEMNWQAGGVKQADRLPLRFQKGSVDCSLNFFQSEELEKYIKSFGAAEVPVIFDVSYSKSGMPSGALLVRVGEWDASKLQPNERLLSIGQKLKRGKPGEVKVLKIDSPGGCFDPIAAE